MVLKTVSDKTIQTDAEWLLLVVGQDAVVVEVALDLVVGQLGELGVLADDEE